MKDQEGCFFQTECLKLLNSLKGDGSETKLSSSKRSLLSLTLFIKYLADVCGC